MPSLTAPVNAVGIDLGQDGDTVPGGARVLGGGHVEGPGPLGTAK